jgi:hypothetical protein
MQCPTAPQVALITIELHSRDVMERMIRADCSGVDDFEWLAQLRLEYSKSEGPYGGVVAKQTKSTLEYSFECVSFGRPPPRLLPPDTTLPA